MRLLPAGDGLGVTFLGVGAEIGLATLQEWKRQKRVTLVDARRHLHFRLEHLPGALNLPWDRLEAVYPESPIAGMAKDAILVVYCKGGSCGDSKLVSDALQALGHERETIFTLSFGFIVSLTQAWARGLAIECGCFGGGDWGSAPVPVALFRALLLMAMALATYWAVARQRAGSLVD